MGQRLLLAVLLLLICTCARAQTYVFAQLTGSPVDTAGWNFIGDARLSDTRGDTNNLPDEVMVCPVTSTFRSGAVFYRRSLNLGACQKFEAEFDYRLFDGPGAWADGLAFCFLTEPPSNFVNGGGLGIPSRPKGLIVALDQYCNCCTGNTRDVSKVEIRYGDGIRDYDECPNPLQPTIIYPPLRSNEYKHMRIRYEDGNIRLYHGQDTTAFLTGVYRIGFAGFFGFTASTGSLRDNHSVRNFRIRTIEPMTPPEAGRNFTLCSGDTATLGGPNSSNPNLVYQWQPTDGVLNPSAGTTRITLTNRGNMPLIRNYFLIKDSIGRQEGSCSSTDVVAVFVPGDGLGLPDTLSACSGQPFTVPFGGYVGYQYQWDAAPEVVEPTRAGTALTLVNTTDTVKVRRFILRARTAAFGCQIWAADTLVVKVGPAPKRAGPDVQTCYGQPVRIGMDTRPGIGYAWTPTLGLDNASQAQPAATLANATAVPVNHQFILAATDPASGCVGRDTVLVRVNPRPGLQLNRTLQVCAGQSVVLGDGAVRPNRSLWSPGRLLSDSVSPRPTLQTNAGQAGTTLAFTLLTIDTNTACRRVDTVLVGVKAVPSAEAGPATVVACAGTSVLLGNAPVPGVTYAWSPGQFLSRPDTAAPRLSLPADTLPRSLFYRLTASLAGCSAADSVAVTALPQPLARILPIGPACTGDSLRLHAARPNLLNQYLWPLSGNLAGPDIAIALALGGVTFYQSLIVQGPNGCTARDSITITPLNPPARLAGPEHTLCPMDSVRLGLPAVPGLVYAWRPRAGLSDTASANPTYKAVNYSEDFGLSFWIPLLATDPATGCRTLDSARITVNRAPHRDAGPDAMFCAGSMGWIGADSMPGHTYGWTGILFADSSYLQPLLPPDTTLRIYEFERRATLQGCSLFDTVAVTAAPRPGYRPGIVGRPSICPGLSADYYLRNAPRGNNYAYTWITEGGFPVPHRPPGDSLTVQWGASNPNAFVAVFAARTTGSLTCRGDTVRLSVRIDTTLRAPLPTGPQCINLQNIPAGYTIDSLQGSTYVWGISGPAAIRSGQGTDSVSVDFQRRRFVRLWINEQINNTLCAGPSDTLLVRVMSAPGDTGAITGSHEFCVTYAQAFAYNRAYGDSRLEWLVPLGSGPQDTLTHFTTLSDTLPITFAAAVTGAVQAYEVSPEGCLSSPIDFSFTAASLPGVHWAPRTDSVICPGFLSGRVYHAVNKLYTWQVTGGEIVHDNHEGTIIVDWKEPPYIVTVTSHNYLGCPGTPVQLHVQIDSSRLYPLAVSHVEENNRDLVFSLQLDRPFSNTLRSGYVEYLDPGQPSASWATFAGLDYRPGTSEFRVDGQYQPEWQYRFRLNTTRACPERDTSGSIAPIYLQVSGDAASGDVQARFSPHRGLAPLQEYQLLRTADAAPWAFVQAAGQDTVLNVPRDGENGFENCYRIAAQAGTGARVLSNRACLEFENRIFIPNIITPNGDGVNDFLNPGNLKLYQGRYRLDIHNRWGKPVLGTTDYQGSWPENSTAPGTYFYRFIYPKGELKGWVEVVK